MKRSFSVVVALLVLTAVIAGCAQAAGPLIKDILGDPPRYAKEQVSLFGVVSNSALAAPQPGAQTKYKGEYDLTDDTGAVIHVKTKKNPPANGTELWVKGVVDATTTPPILVSKVILDWRLIAALSVLVVLAVTLVVLLVRKPVEKPGNDDIIDNFSSRLPLPPPVLDLVCPKCSTANPAGANFCQICREPLGAAVPIPQPGTSGGRKPPPPTSIDLPPYERAVADLLVMDGANRGVSFPLSKEKPRYLIGRSDEMDICLEGDDTVSRQHAAIWWDKEDDAFHIQDSTSTHGTFVKGQKVIQHALMDKDEVQFGRTKLVFRVIASEAQPT